VSTGGGDTHSYGVNGGFSILQSINGVTGVTYGLSIAELIQTTAAASNPTYSWTTPATVAIAQVCFLADAGGGGGTTHPGWIAPTGWF
jgi:hypothetical protein